MGVFWFMLGIFLLFFGINLLKAGIRIYKTNITPQQASERLYMFFVVFGAIFSQVGGLLLVFGLTSLYSTDMKYLPNIENIILGVIALFLGLPLIFNGIAKRQKFLHQNFMNKYELWHEKQQSTILPGGVRGSNVNPTPITPQPSKPAAQAFRGNLQTTAHPRDSEKKYCPSCGAALAELVDAFFCPQCGGPI